MSHSRAHARTTGSWTMLEGTILVMSVGLVLAIMEWSYALRRNRRLSERNEAQAQIINGLQSRLNAVKFGQGSPPDAKTGQEGVDLASASEKRSDRLSGQNTRFDRFAPTDENFAALIDRIDEVEREQRVRRSLNDECG